jgi:hypothetical protein
MKRLVRVKAAHLGCELLVLRDVGVAKGRITGVELEFDKVGA